MSPPLGDVMAWGVDSRWVESSNASRFFPRYLPSSDQRTRTRTDNTVREYGWRWCTVEKPLPSFRLALRNFQLFCRFSRLFWSISTSYCPSTTDSMQRYIVQTRALVGRGSGGLGGWGGLGKGGLNESGIAWLWWRGERGGEGFTSPLTSRWVSGASRGSDGDGDGDGNEDNDDQKPSTSSSVWSFLTGGGSSVVSSSPEGAGRGDRVNDGAEDGDYDQRHDSHDEGLEDESRGGQTSDQTQLIASRPEDRYREVLAIPINRRPLFPGVIMPAMVTDTRIIKELIEVRKQGAQAYVGTFLSRGSGKGGEFGFDGVMGEDVDGVMEEDESYDVGTFAQVHTVVPHDQGAQLLLLGHRRIRRTGVVGTKGGGSPAGSTSGPLRYRIEHIRDAAYNKSDDMLKASTLELISTLKELLHMHPLYNEQMRNFIQFGADFHDPSRLADLAASLTSGEGAELQRVLEEVRVPERVEASLVLLRKEANLLKLQQDIGTFCLEVFIFGYWCSL